MDNQNYDNQNYDNRNYTNSNYGTPNYGNPNWAGMQPDQKKTDSAAFGIVAMVLGILALLLFCTWINYILGIIAIVFGIIQLVKHRQKGMAIAGIVMSGVSFLLTLILYAGIFSALGNESSDFYDYYNDYYDDYYNDYYNDYYDNYEEYYNDFFDDYFKDYDDGYGEHGGNGFLHYLEEQ